MDLLVNLYSRRLAELGKHVGGYAYAVIGGVGPVEFYANAVDAVPIEADSEDIYQGLPRVRLGQGSQG
jgi:hypothetical protein